MSNNIYESLRMENASLNTLYKNAMSKMKKMQNEYESIYLNYLNENQQRENTIKNNYFKYQNLFQKQYEREEKNYIEEINKLKLEINEKNKIINILQKNNAQLKNKLAKNDLTFHFKEKEYQKELLKKDRLLIKSSEVVKKNSKEVMEDIQKLKDEINYFQNKICMNNINENDKSINSYSNLNYYSNKDFSSNRLKKNPSSNDFNNNNNIYGGCNCNCHKNETMNLNKSFYSVKYPNLLQSQNPIINNKSKDYNNILYEIYSLRHKVKKLSNLIKQKDEEILFWKNLRRDLCLSNNNINTQNYKNVLNNYKFDSRNKSINHIKYFNLSNSNKKNDRRSFSKSVSNFRPLKKDINLNLVDCNMSKPSIKSLILNERKED